MSTIDGGHYQITLSPVRAGTPDGYAKHDNLVYLLLTIPAVWSKEKGPLQAGTL
jgi:hypothetical protein